MYKIKFLKLLSIASLFTIIFYSTFAYAVCQILLFFFVFLRIKSFDYLIEWRTSILSLILILSYFVPILFFQSFQIDSTLKVLNFSLLFIAVQKNDTKIIIQIIRLFMLPALIYSILIYFDTIPDILNTRYDGIFAFGRNANSSIFFEADYAGITAAIIAISSRSLPIKFYSMGVNLIADYLFGTVAIIGDFFKGVLQNRTLKLLTGLFVIFIPWILYYLGPIVFEQRYYIWYSYLSNVDLLKIYDPMKIQNLIYTELAQSPWGLSGLNLHNGFFESISYKGITYTLLSIALIIKAYLKSNKDIFLILFFIGLFQMFSISLGGLSFPSLVFSFLIIEKIKYDR